MLPLYVAAGAVALLAAWIVYTHNVLVRARNKVREAFSGIYVQLEKRQDLVPNLVEAVSSYARHERMTLGMVAKAREQALAAATPRQVNDAEGRLSRQMRGLLALVENYPELRASTNFGELMRELVDVENEIQAARSLYNQNVSALNTYAQSFPASLVAGRMRGLDYPFLSFEGVGGDAAQLVSKGFAA